MVLGRITLHVLATVSERISATQVRAAVRSGRRLDPLVGRAAPRSNNLKLEISITSPAIGP
jgi:hypothetical protein